MKQIKEIYLNLSEIAVQSIYVPDDAEIIGAKTITDDSTVAALFVLTDSLNSNMTLKKFKVCDTNETIYSCDLKYIDSCTSDSKFKHILEIL